MAKVVGPLMSIEARGKIADSLVFFPWKGRACVRQWVKPTNPQSTDQGYVRAATKAIGLAIKAIESESQGFESDSVLYELIRDKTPSGLNWNAFATQGFLKLIMADGAIDTSALDDLITAYASLAAGVKTDLEDAATALGIPTFTFPYGGIAEITGAMCLYFLALSCEENEVGTAAPWDTAVDSWADTDSALFVASLQEPV